MASIPFDRKNAERVFEKWKSDLIDKPRGKDHLYSNFDDLFFELKRHFMPEDVAHEYINRAITEHLPSKYILNKVYDTSFSKKSMSKEEFFENWRGLITSRATQAYYDSFPLKEETGQEKIQLPKGMSKEEYRKQRRHAQEFPLLDLASIQAMHESMENDDATSFEDLVGNLNDEDKSRNS